MCAICSLRENLRSHDCYFLFQRFVVVVASAAAVINFVTLVIYLVRLLPVWLFSTRDSNRPGHARQASQRIAKQNMSNIQTCPVDIFFVRMKDSNLDEKKKMKKKETID